jgi:hypothetical protein
LARGPQNLWGRLLTERERVFAAIEEVCKENNLETLVLKSNADM